MRILFLGDIFGKPGRQALKQWLPDFRMNQSIDFVIANGENAAGGKGVTRDICKDLFKVGIDVLTGGNHSFHHRDSYDYIEQEQRLLRPANLPPGTPGRGLGLYETDNAQTVAVINLLGRAFMRPIDCPFRAADALVNEARRATPIVIVDFHAEATSEKYAMTYYLDGRTTAVIGTHTHIPTADARISDKGTAAITDVGMTGPYDSIIGVDKDIVLDQLITGLPVRHEVADGPGRVCGLLLDLDPVSGRTLCVTQIQHPDWPRGE